MRRENIMAGEPARFVRNKGDMLIQAAKQQEPASGAAGEQPSGKSCDKSSMLVADEPQGCYPTSPTEQVLRQLVLALERTIKDKEKIYCCPVKLFQRE